MPFNTFTPRIAIFGANGKIVFVTNVQAKTQLFQEEEEALKAFITARLNENPQDPGEKFCGHSQVLN